MSQPTNLLDPRTTRLLEAVHAMLTRLHREALAQAVAAFDEPKEKPDEA